MSNSHDIRSTNNKGLCELRTKGNECTYAGDNALQGGNIPCNQVVTDSAMHPLKVSLARSWKMSEI